MRTGELAQRLGAELSGSPDAEIAAVKGASDIVPGCLTFVASKKLVPAVASSAAAAVLVDQYYDELAGKAQLKVANPQLAFAKALGIIHVAPPVPRGIMPGAVVGAGVTLGKDVTVHPGAQIGDGSVVGDRTVVHPNAVIGSGCRVGTDCVLYAGVVLREGVTLGDRVIVHPNAVLGADGFGYVFDAGRHHKIPQVGTVEIGSDVEIGAGTCIDRATTGATVIGEGTKIDNLVQIAHNVKIGRHCIIVSQVGIAGSTTIGDYVVLGGQVGVADHAVVEAGTMVGAQSGVMGTVAKGVYIGSPMLPHKQWFKSHAIFVRLPELARTIKHLEETVKKLEEKNNG